MKRETYKVLYVLLAIITVVALVGCRSDIGTDSSVTKNISKNSGTEVNTVESVKSDVKEIDLKKFALVPLESYVNTIETDIYYQKSPFEINKEKDNWGHSEPSTITVTNIELRSMGAGGNTGGYIQINYNIKGSVHDRGQQNEYTLTATCYDKDGDLLEVPQTNPGPKVLDDYGKSTFELEGSFNIPNGTFLIKFNNEQDTTAGNIEKKVKYIGLVGSSDKDIKDTKDKIDGFLYNQGPFVMDLEKNDGWKLNVSKLTLTEVYRTPSPDNSRYSQVHVKYKLEGLLEGRKSNLSCPFLFYDIKGNNIDTQCLEFKAANDGTVNYEGDMIVKDGAMEMICEFDSSINPYKSARKIDYVVDLLKGSQYPNIVYWADDKTSPITVNNIKVDVALPFDDNVGVHFTVKGHEDGHNTVFKQYFYVSGYDENGKLLGQAVKSSEYQPGVGDFEKSLVVYLPVGTKYIGF